MSTLTLISLVFLAGYLDLILDRLECKTTLFLWSDKSDLIPVAIRRPYSNVHECIKGGYGVSIQSVKRFLTQFPK